MRRGSWMPGTAMLLVFAAGVTTGLGGCSDDGTGDIPSSLYARGAEGGADDPGVSTQSSPGIPPPPDASVDVGVDTGTRPPRDSGGGGDADADADMDSGDADADAGT